MVPPAPPSRPSVGPPATRSTRRPGLVGAVLFLCTAVLYLATASYAGGSVDVVSADVGAWRVATAGSPSLDGLDLEEVHGDDRELFVATGRDGHLVISRSPGVVAASVPAYAIQRLAAGPAVSDISAFTLAPAAVTAALLAACSVLLLWASLAALVPLTTRTWVAALFAFATPVWSVAADGMWTHTITVFAITGMAYAASREAWWLVGIFGGVGVWGRLHLVLVAAAVALLCAVARRQPSVVLKVALPGAVLTALASLWTNWHYGRWLPSGGYEPGSYVDRAGAAAPTFANDPWLLLQNEAGLWIAPDRGLLVWTPVLLLLVPALLRSWPQQPAWTRGLVVGGIAYTLVQGWVNVFHGGDSFYGYRHGLELLACLAPALALALAHTRRPARLLLGPVLAVQLVAFMVGGIFNAPLLHYDRSWTDNAFISAMAIEPFIGMAMVLAAAGGVLVQRIWFPQPATEESVGAPA